jgi:IS30 family transposase
LVRKNFWATQAALHWVMLAFRMTYTHLTQDERYQSAILGKANHDQSTIARLLKRHKSTIGRELRRNRGLRAYRAKQANIGG